MSNISNGAPRFILNGIRDESVLAPVAVPEVFPQHLPHVYLLAERGDLKPQLIDPTLLTTLYGSSTFNHLSKFFTMGSAFANVFSQAANTLIVQRVVPADAVKPAMFTLGIELVADSIKDYERDEDGVAVKDENGAYVLTDTTTNGLLGRLVVNRDVTRAVGAGEKKKGQLMSSTGTQSDFYPILDLEVPSPGAFGNNVGVSLWAPNSKGSDPMNVNVAVDQLSQLYRLRFYERPNTQTTAVVKLTQDRASNINFSFRKDVVDTSTDTKYGLQLRIKDYANSGDDGTTPMPGPMGNLFVYQDNLDAVLTQIYDLEQPLNPGLAEGTNAQHQINFIGGVDFYANPYYAFRLQGTADGGVNFNDTAIYYAEGGSDGTLSGVDANGKAITPTSVYDALCKEQFDNYGDLDGIEMLDDARYPVSAYWDAGFSIDTKKSMISLLGKRKDIVVYVGTYIAGGTRLASLEQRSMAASLRSYAMLFPESSLYGTSTCRAVFFMQSGQLASEDSDDFYPHLLDHAYKRSRYCGSGDGIMKNAYAYDAAINNQVQLMKNMDALWEPNEVRNTEWGLGLNYAQTYNRRQAYVPHVQTVYDTESSVLRDEIALTICVDIEKQCQIAYRMLGTDTRRTTAQTLAELNRILENLCKDRYDNRVVISVNSFRTIADQNSRVRYSCEVSAAFNKGMYIGSFTVVSRNQEDLV
ncbi:tail sheath protein [Erwinia phage AH06]|nr:tail sheath protein [Erwinia phage AH06]